MNPVLYVLIGQYAVRFIPRENGLHYVHVLFDGYHIPDSPFRIMVGKVDAADAGKVTAYGDGLHTGTTGQCFSFFICCCLSDSEECIHQDFHYLSF